MKPKKLVLLFPHSYKQTSTVCNSLIQDLKEIFSDLVDVSIAYSDMDQNDAHLDGDLFLLPAEGSIFHYESLIPELDKLLILTRAIRRESLPLLTKFPKGSSVLVVNASHELTTELSNALYEIGLSDINWVPFDLDSADWTPYQGITFAIHPNEAALVPPFIEQSFDIGERRIDTYSMVRIASKLGLNNDIINSRLLIYSRNLIEPESSITATYFDNYLKSLILKYYVHVLEEGLVLCDTSYHVLYENAAAENILGNADNADSRTLTSELFMGPLAIILEDDFTYDRIELQGINYAVTKTPIIISGVLTSFCITFRDGTRLRSDQAEFSLDVIRRGLLARTTFPDILYRSSAMTKCIHLAKQAAATDFSILIEGESGTGKELLAQAIHNHSPRHSNPFVAINCAAMPESLLESELFGYEGGAFTGARRQGRAGLFEQANGGTIFLDEIGDMPSSLQALLLRALQEKQIMRVGGDHVINVDVRVIAATNKSLAQEVRDKRFRADLFYRLNVLPVRVPPLRQRTGDIQLLLEHFLQADFVALTKEQLQFLTQYSWPGNVRQLQNFSAYFKTTHSMDGFFGNDEGTVPPDKPNLLYMIQQNTRLGHGIGRTTLLEQLHRQGIDVSDAWLRQELNSLEKSGFITKGRGRSGCQITVLGRRHLLDSTVET